MFTEVQPFLLYTVSSVHVGSGSDVGIVDLPIQREQHTGFPKIESSSLKGAIRATCFNKVEASEENEEAKNEARRRLRLIFGSDPKEAKKEGKESGNTQASAIAFADARMLLFPVRSMRGVFAWVTCPFVIRRFRQERRLYTQQTDERFPLPQPNTAASDELYIANGQERIVLEEYTFTVKRDEAATQLAKDLGSYLFPGEENELAQRLVVLKDDAFRDFVTLSTEVNARVSIDTTTGTAEGKALWYEENVPPEAVFYSFVFAGNVRGNELESLNKAKEVLNYLLQDEHFPPVFQLGGNATLGRGMLRRIWL